MVSSTNSVGGVAGRNTSSLSQLSDAWRASARTRDGLLETHRQAQADLAATGSSWRPKSRDEQRAIDDQQQALKNVESRLFDVRNQLTAIAADIVSSMGMDHIVATDDSVLQAIDQAVRANRLPDEVDNPSSELRTAATSALARLSAYDPHVWR